MRLSILVATLSGAILALARPLDGQQSTEACRDFGPGFTATCCRPARTSVFKQQCGQITSGGVCPDGMTPHCCNPSVSSQLVPICSSDIISYETRRLTLLCNHREHASRNPLSTFKRRPIQLTNERTATAVAAKRKSPRTAPCLLSTKRIWHLEVYRGWRLEDSRPRRKQSATTIRGNSQGAQKPFSSPYSCRSARSAPHFN
jgi:hypothetical protein